LELIAKNSKKINTITHAVVKLFKNWSITCRVEIEKDEVGATDSNKTNNEMSVDELFLVFLELVRNKLQ